MKVPKDFVTRYVTVLAFCLMGTAAAMGSGSGGGGGGGGGAEAVEAVVGAEAVEAVVGAEAVGAEAAVLCFRRQVALLSKLTTKVSI